MQLRKCSNASKRVRASSAQVLRFARIKKGLPRLRVYIFFARSAALEARMRFEAPEHLSTRALEHQSTIIMCSYE